MSRLKVTMISDLEIVVLMAPYSNIHLHILGGWWYRVPLAYLDL